MFHAKENWFFERLGDSSVRILKQLQGGGSHEVVLDPDTWASVVASVCAKGEMGDTFDRARLFHATGRHNWPTKI